jgi:AcrR family transcriptional regulator
MPRRPHVSVRRVPKTPAALAICDAVLDAAELILASGGIETFSTNAIADRAGVGVASLYRYFPNKESILASVAQRLGERDALAVMQVIDAEPAGHLGERARQLVDVMLARSQNQGLRRQLQREVPEGWTQLGGERMDEAMRASVARALGKRGDLRKGPPAVMAFVVTHAVEMVIESAVRGAPELLASTALRDELVALIVGYLQAPTEPGSRAG